MSFNLQYLNLQNKMQGEKIRGLDKQSVGSQTEAAPSGEIGEHT